MKLLITTIMAFNSCLALATSIDLECDFYHDGEGRGTGTGQTMEFKHEVKLSAFDMKPVDSTRNRRDRRLEKMDKNIIADFEDSQFRITDLKEYDKGRNKFFLEVYKKDAQGNLTLTSKVWYFFPKYIDGEFRDRSVNSFFFPSHVQVQCTFTDEWI